MLTRRVKAYSSSCLQELLVYLHSFCRNLHFMQQKKLPKIT